MSGQELSFDEYKALIGERQILAATLLDEIGPFPISTNTSRLSQLRTNNLHLKFPTLEQYEKEGIILNPREFRDNGPQTAIWERFATEYGEVFEAALIRVDAYRRCTKDISTPYLLQDAMGRIEQSELMQLTELVSEGNILNLQNEKNLALGYVSDVILRDLCRGTDIDWRHFND